MHGLLRMILVAALVCSAGAASAASSSLVSVVSIDIEPRKPSVGEEVRIAARIARSRERLRQEPLTFNVIAVVTLPDNVTRSTMWKRETLGRRESKEFLLPPLFDTKRPGQYKIEFIVYSTDMKRRYSRRTAVLTVGAAVPEPPTADRMVLGIGVYGNALNPSGGGTLLLWPLDRIGLQGSYTIGTFTLTEARLLVRFGRTGGMRPYVGAGYVSVLRETEVIGLTTEFKDSSVSGVIGIEVPFGRRLFGYAEVSGSSVDLEKVVTNGGQTVRATVDYSPVTIGAGIVLYLF